MATAHMNRPYPNIYNTPQSHSPASVSSPHDAQNRALFAQPHAHMANSLYGNYPGYSSMSQVQQPSYVHQAQTQAPQSMSTLMSHQQQPAPQMQHPSHAQSPGTLTQQSPRPKLEPSAMPLHRAMDNIPVHQSPQQRMNGSAQGPPSSSGGIQQSPRSGGSSNSNAAPGPIPATVPVVIKEDHDGSQWISFEYSRDRVKMEYQIDCSVNKVNVDTLDAKFKDDNCVYPRAMTKKEEYKGNRYAYETECNNVGWALASLNACLRGKRGLIQRAVDSWRNSNSDQKLRSRRVRRQQKLTTRKTDGSKSQAGPLSSQGGMQRPATMPSNVSGMGVEPSYHQHSVPGSAADDGSSSGRFAMRAPSAYAPTMNMNMNGMGGAMGSHMGPPGGQPPLSQHHQQQQMQQAHQVSSSSMNYPSQLTAANVPYGQMPGQHSVHYFSGGQA